MPYTADPSQIGKYRPGDGLEALIGMQLAIADQQDPDHCSICGRHLGMWYYGFPFPLCPFCKDRNGILPEWLWEQAGVIFARVPERLRCPPPRKQPCQREKCQPVGDRIARETAAKEQRDGCP